MKLTQQPTALDLALYAGDGFVMSLTFTDKETGAPFPVEGTWLAQVRTTADATGTLAEFAIDTSNAAGGVVILSLTGDEVRSLGAKAYWDVERTPAGGEARTYFAGIITVASDVSRP